MQGPSYTLQVAQQEMLSLPTYGNGVADTVAMISSDSRQKRPTRSQSANASAQKRDPAGSGEPGGWYNTYVADGVQ